ncbi:hypothetical protein Aau02nite_74270 [Amorphoplanes auranticolor]|uniref:ABC-2 type transport system permease protein n=2 Tax=Actinoplanes auranticolor TaxID=47988 RepID=A0A919SRP5_9ACTN|nr:hypothetical protein Aau02nite_74270 [Actinoplanes auranticolor]
MLSLGLATLATGWVPRAVAVAGSLPATGGFLLLVFVESIGAPAWAGRLSPFAHLAPVPLTGADWTATLVMAGLAAIMTVGGAVGYQRRDLQG